MQDGIFTETLLECPINARLLYCGLWDYSDEVGLIHYDLNKIKERIFPNDCQVDFDDIRDYLRVLSKKNLIIEKLIFDTRYFYLSNMNVLERWH